MKILSPAKVNLLLHVTGRRSDGYHDLTTLMCCVGLYDKIFLSFNTAQISVDCRHPEVPQNEGNLAYSAAEKFLKSIRAKAGVGVVIEKHIPVAAGLGGGSSNAAAVLLGLNRHYGNPFSPDDLMTMGVALGADVPFFLYQKPVVATGIGEKLAPYTGLIPYRIILIFPGFNVSTAEIYKNLKLTLTKTENENKYNPFRNKKFDPASDMHNDLEAVTFSMYPELNAVKETLRSSGAAGVLMSGSGPTMFGLFPDSDQARDVYGSLALPSKWQCFLTEILL
jgi:4-diphosphocytidyl-2-C-methyl-D-erythritol kinase